MEEHDIVIPFSTYEDMQVYWVLRNGEHWLSIPGDQGYNPYWGENIFRFGF